MNRKKKDRRSVGKPGRPAVIKKTTKSPEDKMVKNYEVK